MNFENSARRQLFPSSPAKKKSFETPVHVSQFHRTESCGTPVHFENPSQDEESTPPIDRLQIQRSGPCPPTPTRPKSRSPFAKQKNKPRRMSEQQAPTKFPGFEDSDSDDENKMTTSFSVPDLRITPADGETVDENHFHPQNNTNSNHNHNSNHPHFYIDLHHHSHHSHHHSGHHHPQSASKDGKSSTGEAPLTPIRVVRYKTNVNPYSPSRGHPTASKEIQIPTEKGAVPRFVSDFETHGEIGKGSFSTVILCLNRTDGWTYAIKKLVYQSEKMKDKYLKEAYALAALGQHDNIVRYYGSWEDTSISAIYIQTEWCKGGSLRKFVPFFDQPELSKIISHICKALSFMHQKGFPHGDVKPENVLVDTLTITPASIYKLCDLGQIDESGDGKYLAPEVLSFEDFLTLEKNLIGRADVFSLGMTIYELAYERALNEPLPVFQRSQIAPEDIRLPSHTYSTEFVLLLRQMMERDPHRRPSAEQVLTHPLIRDDLEYLLQIEKKKNFELLSRIEELENKLQKIRNKKHSSPNPKKTKKFEILDQNMLRSYSRQNSENEKNSGVKEKNLNEIVQGGNFLCDVSNFIHHNHRATLSPNCHPGNTNQHSPSLAAALRGPLLGSLLADAKTPHLGIGAPDLSFESRVTMAGKEPGLAETGRRMAFAVDGLGEGEGMEVIVSK